MIIYQASYNSCTEESCFGVISLHRTREGAEKAIEAHKSAEKAEYEDIFGDTEHKPILAWDHFQAWAVFETELLD